LLFWFISSGLDRSGSKRALKCPQTLGMQVIESPNNFGPANPGFLGDFELSGNQAIPAHHRVPSLASFGVQPVQRTESRLQAVRVKIRN
jgi:hypothetical protein